MSNKVLRSLAQLVLRLGGVGMAIGLAACNTAQKSSDAAAFVPAPWPPPQICSVLTLADVQTISANAGQGQMDDPETPAPGSSRWVVGCAWTDRTTSPFKIVRLELDGALTPEGYAELVVDGFIDDHPDANVQTTAVTGVGSAAAYIDDVTISQSLFARVKGYRVGVTASSFTPDVLEAALQPLVVKVIGQL